MELLLKKVNSIRIGDCLDENVQMGSLIDEGQVKSVQGFVDGAIAQGAKVLCGGKRLTGGIYDKGNYYMPTVVENVTPEMDIFHEEVFGPVLAAAFMQYDTWNILAKWIMVYPVIS